MAVGPVPAPDRVVLHIDLGKNMVPDPGSMPQRPHRIGYPTFSASHILISDYPVV
jgi:hypothetical protein